MDQPKNMKEKNLRRASPLTLGKSTVNSRALESPKFIDQPSDYTTYLQKILRRQNGAFKGDNYSKY